MSGNNADRRRFGQITKLPSGRYRARYADPDGRTVLPTAEAVERAAAAGRPEPRPEPLRHKAPTTFENRQDAEAWLVDERRLISSGTWTPPDARRAAKLAHRLTFSEYAELWLPGPQSKGQASGSQDAGRIRDLLDRFLLPTFGPLALDGITDDMSGRGRRPPAVA